MNFMRVFLPFIFFTSYAFADHIDYRELNPEQLQILCNALYFSCKRIKVELELQRQKMQLLTDLIVINKEENKGKAYKTMIPDFLKHIQELDTTDREYAMICQNHEYVIDLVMNQEKKVIRILETLAQKLTDAMQTYSDNSKKDIDQMLAIAKKELASLSQTLHIMSNTIAAIEEGKVPIEIKSGQENSSKVDTAQRFIPLILQAIKRSGQMISSLEDNIAPYHETGIKLMAAEYQRCFNCLREKTADLVEREKFLVIINQEYSAALPTEIV
jgi:hypothetical protein